MTTNKPTPSITKRILYILACIFALIIIAALVMPKSYTIKVEDTMKGSSSSVYNMVNNTSLVDQWIAKSSEKDTITLTSTPNTSGVAAEVSWTKENVKNYYKIFECNKNQSIKFETSIDEHIIQNVQSFQDLGNNTKLSWEASGRFSFPKNAFGPFLKYKIKKQMKQSLTLLNQEIETRKTGKYYGMQVEESTQNARHFLTMKSSVELPQISQNHAQNLSAIYQKLQGEGIASIGHPSMLIYDYNAQLGKAEVATAVEVLTPIVVKDLTLVSYQQKNAAVVRYNGKLDNLRKVHQALQDYCIDRNYIWDLPVIEEYRSDPIKEKDASKWQTNVYYIISSKK